MNLLLNCGGCQGTYVNLDQTNSRYQRLPDGVIDKVIQCQGESLLRQLFDCVDEVLIENFIFQDLDSKPVWRKWG